MVLIKGLQKTSLVDYPDRVSCVVFLAGCNFRCPFCQNPDLIEKSRYDKIKTIPEKEFFDFLEERKKWLDGVVISGGEPCMNKDLIEFIKKIRASGLPVKLDTNGSYPGMIRYLADNNMVDYIAMDIKAPLEKYGRASGAKIAPETIRSSIEAVKNAGKKGIDYEFRITAVPGLADKNDMKKIGELLKGSKKISLQKFDNRKTYDPSFMKLKPYTKEEISGFREIIQPYVESVEIRG